MLSMLVLLNCFTYVVPCLVCLISYVLYISIIKSKYSYIKEFVCIVTLNNVFIYILISYKKQHFETNFKEEEKSVTKLLNVFKRNINTATIQIFTLSMFFFFLLIWFYFVLFIDSHLTALTSFLIKTIKYLHRLLIFIYICMLKVRNIVKLGWLWAEPTF